MKKKVLLVDDIKEFRALVKIILSGNYEVVTAQDGEEALRIMHEGLLPDAIVTDLMMPRMDGYQLISRIKEGELFCKIPVIVLSNIDRIKEKNKLKRQGIFGFITKPFDSTELKEGLDHTLSTAFASCN